MPLTIRFHERLPDDISKWRSMNPHEAHAKYKIYEESMSKWDQVKIVLEITIKSLFTLGAYYFIYLKCTKDGKSDLENLKRRTFVHHISNHRPEDAQRINRSSLRTFHQVSGSGIQGHTELLQRNQVRAERNEEQVHIIPLSDIFKSCMEQVQDLRKICTSIKDIIQTKRAYFLENLYDKNIELTLELEKFFNLSLEQQDSYNFIRLLVPFLKEKDLSELLANAVANAKDAQDDKKTIYHRKFEEFQAELGKLSSVLDWLISVRNNNELTYFLEKLFEIGDQYSPRFRTLYDDLKGVYEDCLISMQDVQVDIENKKKIEAGFKNWKEFNQELQKNLAPEKEESYGVYYSLLDHFQDQFATWGFDESFQLAINSNRIEVAFVKFYFSGFADQVMQKMKNFLKDGKQKEVALKECQNKIDQAKIEEEQAIRQADAPETKAAFEKMKRFFIDTQDYNDAVYAMVEIELLFNVLYPNQVDAKFFDFMRTLKQSDFFIKGRAATCNKEFFQDFNAHFSQIDLVIVQLKSILKKI